MEEIDPVIYTKETQIDEFNDLKFLLTVLSDEAIRTINADAHSSKKAENVCQKVSKKEIQTAYGLKISNVQEFIRLELLINENPDAIFQINFIISAFEDELTGSSS